MTENEIFWGFATIIILGVGAQWVAKRLNIPPLLLLLPAGLIAGDVLGLVQPEELLGDMLFPAVTAMVGLLLFQAGLSLRVSELPREARRPVVRLVIVGGTVTFFAATGIVALALEVPHEVAWVMGAILVVSGPTVVGPLLKIVRPHDPVGPILNWESTTLDPIGAVLGVVVLNVVVSSGRGDDAALLDMTFRVGLGVVVGLVAATLLIAVLHFFLVTDDMEPSVALLFAVAAFTVAEVLLSESGLVATVVLGLAIANQPFFATKRIDGFGETLDVLIIGTLFLLLGAMVSISALIDYLIPILIIVAVLVLLVRPLAVALAMLRTRMPWRERAMIAWVDPRGIVAAATATQFSAVLATYGFDSDMVLPVAFGVVFGTGLIYGLTAKFVATRLGVAQPDPTGIGFLGDQPWVLHFAKALSDRGVPVVIVSELPRSDIELPHASLLEPGHELRENLEGHGLRSMVVTARPSGSVQMATALLVEQFGRRRVFLVPISSKSPRSLSPSAVGISRYLHGRTSAGLDQLIESGATIEELDGLEEPDTVPMCVLTPDGEVFLRLDRRRYPKDSVVLGLRRQAVSTAG